MGYELVIGNVSPMENCSFEDWWVHPDLVDRKLIDQIKNANSNEVLIEEHFFENHPIIKKKVTKKVRGLTVDVEQSTDLIEDTRSDETTL